MVSSQLFVATHQQASAFARGTGAQPGSDRWLDLQGLSEIEVEDLGVLVVHAVHAAGADTALSLVDIDLDTLLVFPEAVVEALTELQNTEVRPSEAAAERPPAEPGVRLDDLARKWAEREDAEVSEAQAPLLIRRICELASLVTASDEDERLGLYYLSAV